MRIAIWAGLGLLASLMTTSACAQAGSISGTLSYPSEYMPADMRVCAESAASKTTTCTSRTSNKGRRTTYLLPVEPGDYFVYAATRDAPGYKAYWSEFVRCGSDAKCKSHKPILVRVLANSRLTGIDPQDWYVPR